MKIDWKEIAIKDLEFVHSWLSRNHPGYAEKKCSYPHFKKWFKKGFLIALRDAQKIKGKRDYERVLNNYVDGFKDRHVRLESKQEITDKSLFKREIASIKFLKNNICWIRIKSFYPRTKKQLNQLREVVNNIKDCRRNDLIVFDLRDIEGGYSRWGVQMINNLFSEEYVNSLKNYPYKEGISLDFRASEDNINLLQKELKNLMENESKVYYSKILAEMKRAFRNNKEIVRIHFKHDEKKSKTDVNPVKGRVYALTKEGRSAALLFLDRLLSIKGVIQVGQPTGSDTIYGEVGEVKLPSKNFQLITPSAVRHYIIRKNNEKYIPKYTYKEKMSNTSKLRDWIVNLDKRLNPSV